MSQEPDVIETTVGEVAGLPSWRVAASIRTIA